MLLGENRQGVIVDDEMFREPARADSRTLFNSLVRVREGAGHAWSSCYRPGIVQRVEQSGLA